MLPAAPRTRQGRPPSCASQLSADERARRCSVRNTTSSATIPLEHLAAVRGEVAPGVAPKLGLRSVPGGLLGQPHRGGGVVLGGQDQQRDAHARRQLDRLVPQEREQRARGHLVSPLGSSRRQRPHRRVILLAAEQRHLARPAQHRHHRRRTTEPGAGAVAHRPREQPERHRRRPRALVTRFDAHERQLRDTGRDGWIPGGHRHDMPGTPRRAPQRDPFGIHIRQRTREAHRRPEVLELAADIDQLPRLALAGTEMAVVEGQHRKPRPGEGRGVRRQSEVPGSRRAVRHDHARRLPAACDGRSSQPAHRMPATWKSGVPPLRHLGHPRHVRGSGQQVAALSARRSGRCTDDGRGRAREPEIVTSAAAPVVAGRSRPPPRSARPRALAGSTTARSCWPRSRSPRSPPAGCCISLGADAAGAPGLARGGRAARGRADVRGRAHGHRRPPPRGRHDRARRDGRRAGARRGARRRVIGLMFSGGAALEAAASRRARRELTRAGRARPARGAAARRRRARGGPRGRRRAGRRRARAHRRGDPRRRHRRQRRGGRRHEHAQRRAAARHAAGRHAGDERHRQRRARRSTCAPTAPRPRAPTPRSCGSSSRPTPSARRSCAWPTATPASSCPSRSPSPASRGRSAATRCARLAVVVVATPCPLILAAPIALVSGLSRAARNGVIVKGAGAIETLGEARTVLFDKTGTLTVGTPDVQDVIALGDAHAGRGAAAGRVRRPALGPRARRGARARRPRRRARARAAQPTSARSPARGSPAASTGTASPSAAARSCAPRATTPTRSPAPPRHRATAPARPTCSSASTATSPA